MESSWELPLLLRLLVILPLTVTPPNHLKLPLVVLLLLAALMQATIPAFARFRHLNLQSKIDLSHYPSLFYC